MAKRINLADLVFKVSDDGTLQVMAGSAKKAGKSLKQVEQQTDKTTYATKKGINQTANQTKNFANLARGISGSLVPAYATLAANVFALTAVFGFLKQAADYRLLQEGQVAYAAVTGIAYKTLSRQIMAATDNQIKYTDAAQAAAIGIAAGLSADQLVRLGEAAKLTSIALGRDVTDSFNRLVRGVTKAEPELLDELGIVLRLDTALEKYANQLGKAKTALSQFEKSQAVTGEVLGQVEEKFAAIAEIMTPEVNAINKLNKAFDDLLNTFRMFIAGPAEALASFFSNNLLAAAGALGLFALPILQSILPAFDEMGKNAELNFQRHNAAVDSAKTKLDELRLAQAKARAEAVKTQSQQLKNLQRLAGQSEPAKAGTGMAALQRGDAATPSQIRALRGQLTKGIGPFKGMTAAMKQEWEITLNTMANSTKVKFADRAITQFKRTRLAAEASFTRIKVAWSATMKGMAAAGAFAGKAISKAFSFMSWISLIVLAYEGIKQLSNYFTGLGKEGEDTDSRLRKLLDTQRDLNKEIENMVKGRNKLKKVEASSDVLVEQAGKMFASGQLLERQSVMEDIIARNQELEEDLYGNLPRAVGGAMGGIGTSYMDSSTLINETTKSYDELNSVQQEYVRNAADIAEMEERLRNDRLQMRNAFPGLIKMVDTHGNVIAGQEENFAKYIANSRSAGQAVTNLRNAQDKYNASVKGFLAGSGNANLTFLDEVRARVLELNTVLLDPELNDEDRKKAEANRDREQNFLTSTQAYVYDQHSLQLQATSEKMRGEAIKQEIYGNTILGEQLLKVNALREAEIKLKAKQSELDYLMLQMQEGRVKEEDREGVTMRISTLAAEVQLMEQQNIGLSQSINLTRELGVAANEAFANSMQKGIQGIIEGTMSMKDAFKSMAASILQSLAQVLAKMMTMKILSSAFGLPTIPMADGGIIPMAKGGIIKGYRNGGIATEPTYLVGEGKHNEAVVPLPNGRSIPVEMSGSAGGTNNITINVDAKGGSSTTMDGEKGKALGIAIQAAVMETIQREKRPGGVLSRN